MREIELHPQVVSNINENIFFRGLLKQMSETRQIKGIQATNYSYSLWKRKFLSTAWEKNKQQLDVTKYRRSVEVKLTLNC